MPPRIFDMSVMDTSKRSSTAALAKGLRKSKTSKASDQTIYDTIYEAVLAQRLPPGAKLPEALLGELFGVSRSVVRKALIRLVSDHVVAQEHNQIATVSKPGAEETRQIFQARRVIESEIVRLNAGKLTKSQIGELKRLVKEESSAHQHGQLPSRSQHGMRLHLFLADCCPNRVLGVMQRHLVLRSSIAISLYKAAGSASCFLGDDHASIVEFVESGNGDKAAALACQHLDKLQSLLSMSDEKNDYIDLARALNLT
jgi:DNA-binding GntR family transcriptional regulator